MRRDKFAGGEEIGKFDVPNMDKKLFPYTERTVRDRSIWKSKKEPFGMLMVKERVERMSRYADQPESWGWEVLFKATESKEEYRWNLDEQDILDNYDPVFYLI